MRGVDTRMYPGGEPLDEEKLMSNRVIYDTCNTERRRKKKKTFVNAHDDILWL